jgi:hypothetical protein
MNFTWYNIFNLTEFLATGLVSKTYNVTLENIGQNAILVTQGESTGMVYNGVFLDLNMNDANPFVIDERAIYVDENQNVWLGIQIEET